MKNDLDQFEKNLLKIINIEHNKKYNYKNLMEWNTNEELFKENLREGEKVYMALGCYVAIKE